jgi:hypothetical protein
MICAPLSAQGLPLDVEATPLAQSACGATFVTHTLSHTTTVKGAVTPADVRMYDSNGSGLAINDLNNDGLLDIVLGNLNGPNAIMWNEGGLNFRAQPWDTGLPTRQVNILDVDGDGWMDIVLTPQLGLPSVWRNNGDGTFSFEALPGVRHAAYAMDWADVDGDGDLDLAAASYDAELERVLRDSFLFGGGAGVYYYENQQGTFVPTRLARRSQALAVMFTDLNADGTPDLAVGNDFGTQPDQFWQWQDGGWQEFQPFVVTTQSTMSFAAGDINNDGQDEFYAGDMTPYSGENNPAWNAVIRGTTRMSSGGARITTLPAAQMGQNVLQMSSNGEYTNEAASLGVSAAGWSWSAQFGDLNSDGYLDLYVVNGMIGSDLFPRQGELVEANQAFRSVDGTQFVPAPAWGLGSTSSGRGMSMADLDGDGDLDIVVNNLMSPAQLFENQVCGGENMVVDLHQPGVQNHQAIGARLILHSSTGNYSRDVRAASGYLSGDPSQVHFGFPTGSSLLSLEVIWPDGLESTVESPLAGFHLTVTRP